ncbi:MAG: CARDB domain-containing protein, partial [Saprospiraceae bacterium]
MCAHSPMIPITHSTQGAIGIGTPFGLPAGLSASWASNIITISGTPTESGIFEYTIPLTGYCTSQTAATGTITVNPDTEAPVFTEGQSDLTLDCYAIREHYEQIAQWLYFPTALDDCDANPVVTYPDALEEFDYCTGSTTQVTWTATDAAGNSTMLTRMIIMVPDTESPVLMAPDDLTLNCGSLADPVEASAVVSDWLNSATATDNCDGAPLVTHAGAAQLDFCTTNTRTVTWTAVDACNNTVSITRTITIIPAPAGSAGGPASICTGQSAVLTASGGVSYAWSTGAVTASLTVVPVVTSNYTVSITNLYGCLSQASVQVTVGGSVPSFSFASAMPGDPFNGHVVSPSAGAPEDVYRFRVKYAHPDGVAPAPGFPRMQLRYQTGGVPHPNDLDLSMNLLPGGDFTSGVVYEAVWAGGLAGGTDWNVQFTTADPGGCVFTSAVSPALSEPDVLALPDLAVFADDITFSNYNPAPGATVTVYTRIRNQSNYPADNFVVRLRNEFTGANLGTQTVSLAANSQQILAWTVEMPGTASWNPLRVFADDTDAIEEAYENNNNAIRPIVVGNFPLAGSIETAASAGDIFLGTGCNTLVGSAVYQNLPPATGMNGTSVAGATVIIWLEGGTDTLQTTTNSLGYFIFPSAFCSQPLNVGTYTITGIVTDYTVIDTFQTTFDVYYNYIEPCMEPDLGVQISGLPNCVFPGSVQNFTITVSNSGIGAAAATTLKVITSTGSPILIPTPDLPGGGSFQTIIEQTMPGDQQSFSMSAIADADNVLASECSYLNNVSSISRTPNPETPNLNVFHIDVSPLYYDCQDNIFSVTLHNSSCVAAGSSKMRVVVSHLSSGQLWDTIRVVPPMAAGEFLGFSFRDLFPSALSALGGYRLTFYLDIEEAVVEHNESDNSQSADFALDECYPDLSAVCGYSYSPVNNYDGTEDVLQIPVRVYNSGLSPLHNDFEVEVQIFENTNIIASISYTETKNMNPGEFAEHTVSFPGLDPCAAEYRVRLRVDTQEEVAERFETNNSCEFHALFRDYLPADNCSSADFWDSAYPTNEPIQAYASVLKRGDFRDEALDVQFEVRKQGAASWQSLGTTTIGPLVSFGNEYCPQFGASAPQLITFSSAGIWELRVTVDPANKLCETREENNQIIRAFRVVETPDFEVLSQWIDPETLNPTAGQVITVNASFKNLGKAISTTAPLAVSLKLDQDVVSTINLPSGSFPYNGFTTVSFPNIQMPASYTNSALAQAHVLRVIVDTANLVVETNELNNEATRLIILDGAPDARVPVLSYSNGVVTALVKNFGNSPIVQGVLRLYYTNFFGQEFEIPGAQQIWLGSLVVNGQTARTFSWTAPADAYTLIARVRSVSPAESNDQNNERTLVLAPTPLVASAAGFPACGSYAEGMAVVSAVSGGTPPYQYLWSTGAVTTGIGSLVTGTYTVTISDAAGATLVRQVAVEQLSGETYYPDTDGDGYGRTAGALFTCTGAPAGYVPESGDCDDENPSIFPGASEICNHTDDDCNGLTDDIAGFNGISSPIVLCPSSPVILYTNPEAPCEVIIPDYVSALEPVDNCTASDDLTETQSIPAGSYAVSGDGEEFTLNYTVADDEIPANVTSCAVQIIVSDNEPPGIVCPPDQDVYLDPGACCQVVTWAAPAVSDNCQPAAGPSGELRQDVASTNYWVGYAVNIENKNLTSNLKLTKVNVQATLTGATAGNYPISIYMKPGTYVGFANNAAAWTKVGEITAGMSPGYPGAYFDVPVNFTIPAGQIAGLYAVANQGIGADVRLDAVLGNAPTEDANLRISQQPGNWVNGLFDGVALLSENPRPQLRISYEPAVSAVELMQLEGPVSGSTLCSENAPYTVRYEAVDGAGNTADCQFEITLHTQNGAGSASAEPTGCLNAPLTPVMHNTVGVTGIGTPEGLPAGLSASWEADVLTISGTPTESGVFPYSIPLEGPCLEDAVASGTITVQHISGGLTGANQTICPGEDIAGFTEIAGAEGDGDLSYQWEMRMDGEPDWTPIPDATDAEYDHDRVFSNTRFRRITSALQPNVVCTAPSNEISITVKPACELDLIVGVGNGPGGSTIQCGDTVIYTVRAVGFNDYLGRVQFSLNWDTAQLDYLSFSFDTIQYAPGGDL